MCLLIKGLKERINSNCIPELLKTVRLQGDGIYKLCVCVYIYIYSLAPVLKECLV